MDYYDILGIQRNATLKDIKAAYRKLAKEYHPDVNNSSDADRVFKEINEAYDTLSDENKRKAYDFMTSNDTSYQSSSGSTSNDSSSTSSSDPFSDFDFVDFSAEREETGIDWRELVDGSTSLYHKLKALFEQIIILPSPELQTSVFLSFVMTPSAMSNNLPIGVLYGSSGSGKSETTKLISALHNTPINAAASSFASIRNQINNSRFYDSDKTFERNFLLVWDDINESVFLKRSDSEHMFSMFKSGINRKALITIADRLGTNMEFHPFSPKCVSTISPFWDHPKLIELKRRIIPFLFKRVPESSHVAVDLISCDDINFNGLNNEYECYWRFKENRETFNKAKRSLFRMKSSVIPLEIQRLYTDVIATLSTVVGLTASEALKQFEMYFEFINANVLDSNVGISHIFDDWIEPKECDVYDLEKLRGSTPPWKLLIQPKTAYEHFDNLFNNGEISARVERSVIESLFINRGYTKVKTKAGYQWMKLLHGVNDNE